LNWEQKVLQLDYYLTSCQKNSRMSVGDLSLLCLLNYFPNIPDGARATCRPGKAILRWSAPTIPQCSGPAIILITEQE
jgi:hypothetical protein